MYSALDVSRVLEGGVGESGPIQVALDPISSALLVRVSLSVHR